jgi:HK97 gp10 family phage protein
MISFKFDTAGLLGQVKQLGDAANAAVRPAAQTGAEVLYKEARQRAPEGDKEHYFQGTNKRYGPFQPGNLRDSIYQVYSKDESTNKRAVYHISWNTKIGAAVKYAPYGWMVENGTSRTPASPFLRPAFDATQKLALDVASDEFMKRIDDAVKKASA